MFRTSRNWPARVVTAGIVGALVLALPGHAGAQSLLDRPPNLGGTWVDRIGVVDFHFLHRFTAGDAPTRKVANGPTFLLATGLPANAMIGLRYGTNSTVAPRYPNEWEFFGRFAAVSEGRGAPVDATLHAGYNLAAESFDAELTIARRLGRLRVLGAARAFSDGYATGESRMAIAGGATFRLSQYVALSGDVGALLDRSEDEDVAWGAGLQLQLPYTPHTLSLQVTNTNTSTLQGSSIGTGITRYGFEFTIPITLARYFGGRGTAAQPTGGGAAPAAAGAGANAVRVVIQNLAYQTTTIEIAAGATVTWVNEDAVAHTSTSDDGRWDSGLIEPGESWSMTFSTPGTFGYHCTPHPFMTGRIIVR